MRLNGYIVKTQTNPLTIENRNIFFLKLKNYVYKKLLSHFIVQSESSDTTPSGLKTSEVSSLTLKSFSNSLIK